MLGLNIGVKITKMQTSGRSRPAKYPPYRLVISSMAIEVMSCETGNAMKSKEPESSGRLFSVTRAVRPSPTETSTHPRGACRGSPTTRCTLSWGSSGRMQASVAGKQIQHSRIFVKRRIVPGRSGRSDSISRKQALLTLWIGRRPAPSPIC